MHNPSHHRLLKAIIFALIVALVFLTSVLWRQFAYLQKTQTISTEQLQFSQLLKRKTLDADDAVSIQSWMTFDYISLAFKIPMDFLKNALGITDAHYPHISIAHYSRITGLDTVTFTAQVQVAVRQYFVLASSTSATSTKP